MTIKTDIINHLSSSLASAAVLGGLGYLGTSKDYWPEGTLFGVTYGLMGMVVNSFLNTNNSYTVSRFAGVALKVTVAAIVVFKQFNYTPLCGSPIGLAHDTIRHAPLRAIGLIIALLFVEIIAYQYRTF